MLNYAIRYKFSILLAILIGSLSLMPGGRMPGSVFFSIPHFDKVAHFSMYALLSFVSLQESRSGRKFTPKQFILLSIVFFLSVLMEILQGVIAQSREAEWFDLLANLIGCGMAYLFYRMAGHFRIFSFLRS